MQSTYDDSQYWRERADEARIMTSRLSDTGMKDAMLRVAVEYDQIARVAERRFAQHAN